MGDGLPKATEKDKSLSHSHKYCIPKPATPEHRVLSSEDAGHRDWRNVRKNNLQNTAKEPEKPTTTIDSRFLFMFKPDVDWGAH